MKKILFLLLAVVISLSVRAQETTTDLVTRKVTDIDGLFKFRKVFDYNYETREFGPTKSQDCIIYVKTNSQGTGKVTLTMRRMITFSVIWALREKEDRIKLLLQNLDGVRFFAVLLLDEHDATVGFVLNTADDTKSTCFTDRQF